MNIQPANNNNYNISYGRKLPNGRPNDWSKLSDSIKQFIVNTLPEKTLKDSFNRLKNKKIFDERISRPAENRLIMGATAILTQPAIDYYNHRVDEETRTVSRNRTIAKIIAGTTVGIIVRGSCYQLIEKMTDLKALSKFGKALLPKDKTVYDKLVSQEKFLKNYRSSLSTGIALLVMCFTNFLIDAPLTVRLTNKLNAKSLKDLKGKEESHG